jgi:ribosome-binding protein aMBF1 (putative translation factor)
MDWETHKKLLLKDPKFRRALKETRLEYEIARTMILARVKNKMTQKELAKKLKTKQSVISRVENAQTTPTISFLKRLASVFNTELKIEFGNI